MFIVVWNLNRYFYESSQISFSMFLNFSFKFIVLNQFLKIVSLINMTYVIERNHFPIIQDTNTHLCNWERKYCFLYCCHMESGEENEDNFPSPE